MTHFQKLKPRDWSAPMAAVLAAVGGITELAKHLRISPSAIYQWQGIPSDRVEHISRLTGIPKERLRPDIWDMG